LLNDIGLSDNEIAKLRHTLRREPTDEEMKALAVSMNRKKNQNG
jgi:phosphoribosylformylglycinamidine (FGAM) synthase-like enzyme